MSVEFKDGVRADTKLLILLAGGTGSGKTESSMRLATGLAGGQKFAVIDTERGRALHKADDYTFAHADLEEPFTPERYAEALKDADAAGFPVIVVDSGSHEWDGVGGVLDMQAAEFKRLGEREQSRFSSWVEPKQAHKRFVQELLRVRAHVILCLRAEDKVEIAKDENGKTIVRPKQALGTADGWIPICERRLPFEATISLLLLQSRPGVPIDVKLERRHKDLVPLDRELNEDVGRQLAAWAAGNSAGDVSAPYRADAADPSPPGAAGASPAELASDAERRAIIAAAEAAGLEGDRAREIITEVTGQATTAGVPKAKVADVIAAMQGAQLAIGAA